MKTALHANEYRDPWTECNWRVYQEIIGDDSEPSINLFPELLKKIQIHVYAGERDIICNYIGLDKSLSLLEWGGKKGFGEKVQLTDYGSLLTSRNLSFYVLTNGSHMAPFDIPLSVKTVVSSVLEKVAKPGPSSSAISTKTNTPVTSVPTTIKTPINSPIANLPISSPSSKKGDSSQLFAAVSLFFFVVLCIFAGLFIRRKILETKWYS